MCWNDIDVDSVCFRTLDKLWIVCVLEWYGVSYKMDCVCTGMISDVVDSVCFGMTWEELWILCVLE